MSEPAANGSPAAPTTASVAGPDANSDSFAPFCNTGRKNPQPDKETAFVDWLAFSVLWGSDAPYPTAARERLDKNATKWLLDLIHEFTGWTQVEPVAGGRFGYLRRLGLGPEGRWGTVLFGGESQRQTVSFQINGEGCRRLNVAAVADQIDISKGWITRVDLAHDDLEGKELSICRALELYRTDKFTSGGRPPKARLIDDLGNGTGRTLYIGTRGAGKMLRIYEKGKQLGEQYSPWVRTECELRNRNRIVPTDVLRTPGKFLSATYPALAFLSKVQQRIETFKREAKISINRMLDWLHHAAGKSIWAAIEIHGGDINAAFDRITRTGWPPRVAHPFETLGPIALKGLAA